MRFDNPREGAPWSDSTGSALVRPDGSTSAPHQAFSSRAIVLGDSYAALQLVVQATAVDFPPRAEFTYANAELGWPWDLVGNAGASGESAADIAARTASALALYKPAWVLIPGGAFINSVNAGVSYAAIIASLTSIFDACRGLKVVWCTAPVNALYLTTASKRDIWARVNTWALQQCRTYGFCGVDTSSAITDTTTGYDLAGALADGLHPAAQGASAMGRAIARAVRNLYGLQPSPAFASSMWAGSNLIFNPFATGSNADTTNGYFGNGVTGVGPSGWNGILYGTGAAVSSKVASATEVPVDWERLAITVGATVNSGAGVLFSLRTATTWAATTAYAVSARRVPTVSNGYIYRVIVAGTTAGSQPTWPTTPGATVTDGTVTWQCYDMPTSGDTIKAGVEFAMSGWTGGAYPTLYIECLDNVSAAVMQGGVLLRRDAEPPPTYALPSGVLVTPEITIPATTVNVNVIVRASGAAGATGNFDIRRLWCGLTNR